MKRVINARGTEFGHEYYDSIDEQLKKWENEPFELMAEMEVAELHNEQDERKHAYIYLAEYIWDAALKALNEGKLEESMAIGDVYNQWLEVCEKVGVL